MAADEHEYFLRTIFERPEDVAARLVYADWLDEHGHPGGELVRVRHRLSLADPSHPERTALLHRERELVAACDRDWLERLERADWKLHYLRLRPEGEDEALWAERRRVHWSAPSQEAISRALAAFEEEIGRPLPRSWRSFAHGCGPGQLGSWYDLFVPCRGQDDLAAMHREWSGKVAYAVDHAEVFRFPPEVRTWLGHSVQLGRSDNCDFLVWNTSRVTDPVRPEYEVLLLNNRNLHIMEAFDSFEALWERGIEGFGPEYRLPCFQPR